MNSVIVNKLFKRITVECAASMVLHCPKLEGKDYGLCISYVLSAQPEWMVMKLFVDPENVTRIDGLVRSWDIVYNISSLQDVLVRFELDPQVLIDVLKSQIMPLEPQDRDIFHHLEALKGIFQQPEGAPPKTVGSCIHEYVAGSELGKAVYVRLGIFGIIELEHMMNDLAEISILAGQGVERKTVEIVVPKPEVPEG